jgi:hypothetical protein
MYRTNELSEWYRLEYMVNFKKATKVPEGS